MKKTALLYILLALPIVLLLTAYQPYRKVENHFCSSKSDTLWADSILSSLSVEEKIGQLLNIRVYSRDNPAAIEEIDRLIETYKVGGITFFQGGPVMQAALTNRWQDLSETPLMVCMDAESGLGWRYDSAIRMPEFMTMGALVDNSLIFLTGKTTGRHCKAVGVNMDFSPVVDVNNNAQNPVINFRSFGSDPVKVGEKGRLFMQGLQSENVLAVAKHFPGHGDTDSDSHTGLPLISASRERLDSVELFPYKTMIAHGVDGVMIGHLNVPVLDDSETPSSLSKSIVTGLLKDEMGFEGLVVTDGLDMKGAGYGPGKIEVAALRAGNDMLLLPPNVELAVSALKKAIKRGKIPIEQLDRAVRKNLIYKSKAGLQHYKSLDLTTIYSEVNDEKSQNLKREIFRKAATVIVDDSKILPLDNSRFENISVVTLGATASDKFGYLLETYTSSDLFKLPLNPSVQDASTVLKACKDKQLVVLYLRTSSRYSWKRYGLSQADYEFVKALVSQNRVVLAVAGNPYLLDKLPADQCEALLVGYENSSYVGEVLAQIITGSLPSEGQLPVDVSPFKSGSAHFTTPGKRLKYGSCSEVGISPLLEHRLDSIVKDGLKRKAYPGCQLLMAKDGAIFYDKQFGFHTSKEDLPVKSTDLYDLASLTKVLATTLAVMRLSEENKLDIDRRLGDYLPELIGSNKEDLVIRDVMTHQARLTPWIPFYTEIERTDSTRKEIYSSQFSAKFPYQVAESMYLRADYRDTIFTMIIESDLLEIQGYRYSDLGFILLKEIVERITEEPFDSYVMNAFYKPLNLKSTLFLPLDKFSIDEVVPTEKDSYWRDQLVDGYVHDMAAAMLGGVAGHAGLFSNAHDVAVIMQMLLQGGRYGGVTLFRPETVREFTSCQFPLSDNRRGLGFDKPSTDSETTGPVCESASLRSFGHSGFTGCYTWADPETGLIYIFLSNRVFPTAGNRVLLKRNIRTELHQSAYSAIKETI